jgi:REP element-mobilizing transposase RayT
VIPQKNKEKIFKYRTLYIILFSMKKRKHLHRLSIVYQSRPHYFITTCTHHRQPVLNRQDIHDVLRDHWAKALDLHGWAIGSYVVMPDHVHFFCTDVGSITPLSHMVGSWKEWSAKTICSAKGLKSPFWQKEFFDHLLRSDESYAEKWEYVRQNPVRAGFVLEANDWKFAGSIDYV